jgi:hypothetical protein
MKRRKKNRKKYGNGRKKEKLTHKRYDSEGSMALCVVEAEVVVNGVAEASL